MGQSEFARDASFGYTSSNLREFIAEKSATDSATEGAHHGAAEDRYGTITPDEVHSISLSDIREGRPERVVGSHVGLTSRQVAKAQERGGLTEAELDVPTLVDPDRRDAHVADISRHVIEALDTSDVLLFTSRTLLRGGDADDSLAISRNVSTAVIEVVQAALQRTRRGWSRRAASPRTTSRSAGSGSAGPRSSVSCCRGMVSVFRPIQATPEAVGTPYVVFAGNVGNDDTLADVIDLFTGNGLTGGVQPGGLSKSELHQHFRSANLEGEHHLTTVGWIGLGEHGRTHGQLCLAGHTSPRSTSTRRRPSR